MNRAELIASFRKESGDRGVPAFWPEADVSDFLDQGQNECAERARLLPDKTTTAVTRIALVTGQREYRIHPKIFDVVGATIQRPGGNRRWCVDLSTGDTVQGLIDRSPDRAGWGERFYVYGSGNGEGTLGKFLVLDRAPTVNGGYLHLDVYRYPLEKLVDSDYPEIEPRYHPALVHWACKVAYETRDMEYGANDRSKFHEAEFEKLIGERHDANVMRKHLRHRAGRVRPARF